MVTYNNYGNLIKLKHHHEHWIFKAFKYTLEGCLYVNNILIKGQRLNTDKIRDTLVLALVDKTPVRASLCSTHWPQARRKVMKVRIQGIVVSYVFVNGDACCIMLGIMNSEVKQRKVVHRKHSRLTEKARTEEQASESVYQVTGGVRLGTLKV
uniref:Non-structural maintenance of chromosomes element 4 homolog A n=1 Tax=Tanacetum cinerariifolium TaxID=118510 RepID=A0A6L2M7J6_TANCI|nr:non-structural maintenance of chromosomes element 4 homolog A [Tanacetum cinerariifolium]